ncbi:MAG: hypothetical protein IJJ71_01525 [Treponema sp.]|uniref:reverse transcriptase domain-containing protein n=1 Tax=Treponema sp. TaxID=166 RepID=UPI0025D0D735|nr:reverse transcriptase domain-containing protein [Treponema sp.]MBR0494839.1 hypothetical protein [Treponema sp.]
MAVVYDVPLEDVFAAYYECRKHKRNKSGALQFEVDLESNLIQLWQDLRASQYELEPSSVFIVEKPKPREVFAASFRDRIVHHLLLMYLNPLFERYFIYDSYSCRTGKGTHFGITRVQHFIRSCSQNGKRRCWILKIDIQSFFMSISKAILYRRLCDFIEARYTAENKAFVLYLCKKIIFNNPTEKCIFKSPTEKWKLIPKEKSLFFTKDGYGLPIGNFTSQVFANFYLSPFDHFVKHECGVRYYGRYVDDCVIVGESHSFLKRVVPKMQNFLESESELHVHPKKLYLQLYHKGVRFLGVFVKPSYCVSNPRTFRNFEQSIKKFNTIAENHKPTKEERTSLISSVNSYLGILRHYKSYHLRNSVLTEKLSPMWLRQVAIFGKAEKLSVRGKR